MTSKKTTYHFGICCTFTFLYIVGFLVFVLVWDTYSIFKQIPLSEQNIFSNYVCKLPNYHLKSSDLIKQFQIKSICSFE